MNIKQQVTLRKWPIGVLTLFVIAVVATTSALIWKQNKATSIHAAHTCAEYSGTYDSFGPDNIQEITNDSKVIVIAAVENPKVLKNSVRIGDTPPRVRVTEILKGGDSIKNNTVIPICAGLGMIALPEGDHPVVLLFLEGKDGDVWVPSWSYFGITPQSNDGRFRPQVTSDKSESFTADELRKIVKE